MKYIRARAATAKERQELLAYTLDSVCKSACLQRDDDIKGWTRYYQDWSALAIVAVFDPHPCGFKRKTMVVWWGAEQLYAVYQWRYRKLTAIQQDRNWFDLEFPYAIDEREKTEKLLYAPADEATD